MTDSSLTIQFVTKLDNAKVSGIVVIAGEQPPPPPPATGPITVEWDYDGTTGDAFQLERCTVQVLPCPMAAIGTPALDARQWIDTAIQPDADYCYRLAVMTDGELGGYSNTLCSP